MERENGPGAISMDGRGKEDVEGNGSPISSTAHAPSIRIAPECFWTDRLVFDVACGGTGRESTCETRKDAGSRSTSRTYTSCTSPAIHRGKQRHRIRTQGGCTIRPQRLHRSRRLQSMQRRTTLVVARRTARPRDGTNDACTWRRDRSERQPTPRRASGVWRRPCWTMEIVATHIRRHHPTYTKLRIAAQCRIFCERTKSTCPGTSRPSASRRPNRRSATDGRGRQTSSEDLPLRRAQAPSLVPSRSSRRPPTWRSMEVPFGTFFSEAMAQGRVRGWTRTSLLRSMPSSDPGSNPAVDATAPCATDAVSSTFAVFVRGIPRHPGKV